MVYRNLVGRLSVLAVAVSLSVQPVAAAQFGGILGGLTRGSSSDDDDQREEDESCEEQASDPSIGRQILGNFLGDVTRRTTGRMGRVGSYIPDAEVADTLTNAIACQLDPAEQRKAAAATEEVTQRDEVGATARWESDTRPGVSGSSTVMSRNERRNGRTCMNVRDIIIVDGEETTITKRMCRNPGESRYTLVEQDNGRR